MDIVPQEIMEEIFLCCLFSARTGSFTDAGTSRPPLLFLTVCKRWRKIAVSTPSLWSTVQLTFPRRFLESSSSLGNIDGSVPASVGVRAWLTRASDSPLSLSIQEDPDPQDGVAGLSAPSSGLRDLTIMEISRVVGDFSARYVCLNLDVSPQAFRAICYDGQGVERSFLSLRLLSIGTARSVWTLWDTATAHNLPFFRGNILLHSLLLSTTSLPVNLLLVPRSSFEFLSELALTYRLGSDLFRPTPLLVFQILERCLNLRVCRLTVGETSAPFGFEPQRRLELRDLRELVIVDEYPRTTASLMAALFLPSLERLSYTHCISDVFDLPFNAADEPFLPIQSLQLRREILDPSPLCRLTLHLTADDEDDEPEISYAVSGYLACEGESIQALELIEASYETTRLFTNRRNVETMGGVSPVTLCPNLENVTWTSSDLRTRWGVLEMLRRRCDAQTDVYCPQLRVASVVFWVDHPAHMDEVEQELRSICQSDTGSPRIHYKIICWTRSASHGNFMSTEGVLMSGSSF
ncbi:hypothetical protein AAF712_010194 [Marasmius tenuissimus]|uniref:F-box domain-containing protein n=1 Tax=Marasmius tenuissimus TaxID=585030 RepID=A0ABR2ZPN4_9AGAR|nr:hypothetical protein PM082_010961 [Marasmius tenuissimus]